MLFYENNDYLHVSIFNISLLMKKKQKTKLQKILLTWANYLFFSFTARIFFQIALYTQQYFPNTSVLIHMEIVHIFMCHIASQSLNMLLLIILIHSHVAGHEFLYGNKHSDLCLLACARITP